MAKYLIDYQLEDEEPRHGVFEVKDQEFPHEPVCRKLRKEFKSEGLNEEEIESILDKITILDTEKI